MPTQSLPKTYVFCPTYNIAFLDSEMWHSISATCVMAILKGQSHQQKVQEFSVTRNQEGHLLIVRELKWDR